MGSSGRRYEIALSPLGLGDRARRGDLGKVGERGGFFSGGEVDAAMAGAGAGAGADVGGFLDADTDTDASAGADADADATEASNLSAEPSAGG